MFAFLKLKDQIQVSIHTLSSSISSTSIVLLIVYPSIFPNTPDSPSRMLSGVSLLSISIRHAAHSTTDVPHTVSLITNYYYSTAIIINHSIAYPTRIARSLTDARDHFGPSSKM